jgi:hypothetical protein
MRKEGILWKSILPVLPAISNTQSNRHGGKILFLHMRPRYLPVLLIATFTVLIIYVSGESGRDSYEVSKEMIVLRKIGHEILLNAKDSHSRVLPIQKISDQEFRISFADPLSLVPDSVVTIITRIAKENHLSEYSVNIIDCQKKETVYAFAISSGNDSTNLVACLGRPLPKDCYYISLLFPAQHKKGLTALFAAGAALVVLASLFFLQKLRHKRKQAHDASSAEISTVQIGKYIFHPQQQYLELDGEKTLLTNKEARILYILAAAPNTVIERSLLQKEVWENEGVIVTRSLDMLISKLRKKIAGDPDIKIVNAHGKGYRLEIA